MREVFILFHDTKDWDDASSDVVGVYADAARALKAWNFYLDGLEENWRKEESPGPSNTFNRFSEPEGSTLAYTTIDRGGTGDRSHYVSVVKHDVE